MDGIFYKGRRVTDSYTPGLNWDPPEDDFDEEAAEAEAAAAAEKMAGMDMSETPEGMGWVPFDLDKWIENEKARIECELAWAAHCADKRRKQA